jgi:hypothetical protein
MEKFKDSFFVRKLKPARSGSSAKSKKPHYLNEMMQFLLPFVTTKNPTRTLREIYLHHLRTQTKVEMKMM